MASTLEAIGPYVEQLFEDSDVQEQLRRAAANLRGAKSRAGRARSKKKAAKDPVLRRRLVDGLAFLGLAVDADLDAAAVDGVEGDVSTDAAEARTVVVHAREDLVIARQVRDVVAGSRAG